jgi:hypothetical protein
MTELIKNIGLGLFVNGSYDLLHFDISLTNLYITIGSIVVMAVMIRHEKKERR